MSDEEEFVLQAIAYDNNELLRELLAANASLVNCRDASGRTPLHHAASGGRRRCAELLIRSGANVDAISGLQDAIRTSLVMAAAVGDVSVVQLLVECGADLFYFDGNGHSALQMAQINGHQLVAEQLIAAIERAYGEAKEKENLMRSACVDGDAEAVAQLLTNLGSQKALWRQIVNGANSGDQKSALYLAAEHGRHECVKALLTSTQEQHAIIYEPTGDTILHAAVSSQHCPTVELILSKFPFLMDAPNMEEHSLPLHWACRCSNARIVEALLEAEYPREEVKFFESQSRENSGGEKIAQRGKGYRFVCDLNAPDQHSRSPFYLAVCGGHSDVVRLMAKFKLPAEEEEDRVNEGVEREDGYQVPGEERSPFLFDAYVNGRTPLMIACANGSLEIVRILLENCRVNVNLPIGPTEQRKHTQSLSDRGETCCSDGSGALCEATKAGHVEVVRELFRHGAFDYGNRALGQLSSEGIDGKEELVGLFLQQLVYQDTEHRVNTPPHQQPEKKNARNPLEVISSAAAGTLLNAAVGSCPSRACQLNWQQCQLRELRLEWMVAAATHLNGQIKMRTMALLAITRLDVSGNQLSSLPSFLFTNLHSLRVLNVSRNCLQRLELPPEGADWHSPWLEQLQLDENRLEELPAQLFSPAHLPQLRAFSAVGNRLRRLPASVWLAPRLKELLLADNQLSELHNAEPRRGQRGAGHLVGSRHGATGGPAAARISRQRQREEQQMGAGVVEGSSEPGTSRPSRSSKRESPQQQSKSSSSRRGSRETDGQRSHRTGSGESDGMVEARRGGVEVREVDIVRVNLWQSKIQLTNIEDAVPDEAAHEDNTDRHCSPLQVLDLSRNQFTRMPTCLACCCPRLSRLVLAGNQLHSLGQVECLPSALRHLDASRNKLDRCFGTADQPSSQLRQKLQRCEAPSLAIGQQESVTNANSVMARHSRSRSKSVARSQRSLSMVRNSGGDGTGAKDANDAAMALYCVHKSHCRLEALRTLNLAENELTSLDVLIPLGGNHGGNTAGQTDQLAKLMARDDSFNWRESSEQLKPYLLFPALSSVDLSHNQLRHLSPTFALLGSLAVLNVSQNPQLERLLPELGLLDRLWNIGLAGCELREEQQALREMVLAGNYKTGEVLAQLRQRLENAVAYSKMKLMLLGGGAVGKSTLLQQMRLEGSAPKKSTQHESWSRRMGHSPAQASGQQQRIVSSSAGPIGYPVDVAEWIYEPRRSSKSAPPSGQQQDAFQGPITFRTWDFDGIKQKELQALQLCFFTRRCLYLLLWKVTDGKIALAELHEWLLAIQERAPNSSVLIVGTHSDFVREQPQRFPADYLTMLDKKIQARFIMNADPEKSGLPRVLGSLYISCRSREDVKSLCTLIYGCAADIRQFPRTTGRGLCSRQRQLAEKVPTSFVALEKVAVNMTDELRVSGTEPIMHFHEFWSVASERLLLSEGQKQRVGSTTSPTVVRFRGVQDFRQACLFLADNGVICYYDDTLLRDFVFLDPQWLCSILHGTLMFAARRPIGANPAAQSPITSLSLLHQNSVTESVELYTALKRALRQHLAATRPTGQLPEHSSSPSLGAHFRLLRQCSMSLLRKFELALPFQGGRMCLLASCLPDEYLLRADYPGARVRIRNKLDKLRLHAKFGKQLLNLGTVEQQPVVTVSPIRSYLQNHRRVSRTVATSIDGADSGLKNKKRADSENTSRGEMARILAMEQCVTECLRRLYVMHYIPWGFWGKLSTRLVDDERVGNALSRLFVLSPAAHQNPADDQENGAELAEVCASLGRALNAGRLVNLVQRPSLTRHHSEPREEEEETSFIVVNPAEEATEETVRKASISKKDVAPTVVKCCERGVEVSDDERLGTAEDGNGVEWLFWRTGIEVRALGAFILSLRQFLPLASVQDVNYATHEMLRWQEGKWVSLANAQADDGEEPQQQHSPAPTHTVELLIPKLRLRVRWRERLWELETDRQMGTRLLALVASIVDDLLEDNYSQLGTRFILSPHGQLLVDRLVPCCRCAAEAVQEEEKYWLRENINRNPAARSGGSDQLPLRPTRSVSTKRLTNPNNSAKKGGAMPKSKSSTTTPLNSAGQSESSREEQSQQKKTSRTAAVPVHLFGIEECILKARMLLKGGEGTESLACPRHGNVEWREGAGEGAPNMLHMAPDLLFVDLENKCSVPSERIVRGKLVGRGAFGFVFTGWISKSAAPAAGDSHQQESWDAGTEAAVALKLFEPVEPESMGSGSAAGNAAIRAFAIKWNNDALENATKAYCTVRQELCMLSELRHPHCAAMIAFCASPITLLMELAPHGSLDKVLAEYRQQGQRLLRGTLQKSFLQIAKALEYLHTQQHIVYRDLKSENVLVWRFPSPPQTARGRPSKVFGSSTGHEVLLKLGDYGISRFTHPFGTCKGYGGTEGFMAPEIMRNNGEQEYSERVDCFSFGMVVYELLTLKLPYEGQPIQQMKERIMEAQRPAVSEKELLYATNMLDLMVACWEEKPELRPSSSNLVEICSAPEFAHLLDVALLGEGEESSACLCLPGHSSGAQRGDEAALQWTCWMPTAAQNKRVSQFALLHCSPFGWTEKKVVSSAGHTSASNSPAKRRSPHSTTVSSPPPKLTAIADVFDEFVWTGDEQGLLAIYAMGQTGLFGGQEPLFRVDTQGVMQTGGEHQHQVVHFRDQNSEQRHEPLARRASAVCSSLQSHAVQKICAFNERQIVVVGLPWAVLLCRWKDGDTPPQFLTIIQLGRERLFALAILPSLSEWQIWTGHSAGQIFMHHISSSTDRLAFSTSTNHNAKSVDMGAAKKCPVVFLVASVCTKNLVWSSLEGDARVFQWQEAQLAKTLNCAKILPISESLSSMDAGNVEETKNNVPPHSVTAMELLDLSSRGQAQEQLLVGTSRGIVLIVRAGEMSPISAFRPYWGTVERIIRCPDALQPTTSRILQNELLSDTQSAGRHNEAVTSNDKADGSPACPNKKKRSITRSIMLRVGQREDAHRVQQHSKLQASTSMPGGQIANVAAAAVEAVKSGVRGIFYNGTKEGESGDSREVEANFVTVGTGYRPLLDRFVSVGAVNPPFAGRAGRQDQCAIFWCSNWDWTAQ